MIITHREWKTMNETDQRTWQDVFTANNLTLEQIRSVTTFNDTAIAVVYHEVDGRKHVRTADCPAYTQGGRNDACWYEVELPLPAVA